MLAFIVEALSQYLPYSLNRSLLYLYPIPHMKRLMSISDTLIQRSKEIVAEKKALLKKGDSSIQLAVGEGKDIMSVLRKSSTEYGLQYSLAKYLFQQSRQTWQFLRPRR